MPRFPTERRRNRTSSTPGRPPRESIRNRLRLGFDVLLHCRGGLGRAGTITARLLVELGVQPDDAIRRVRDAHEGTIENDSQLAHVRQCSARAPSVPSRTADDIHDRALWGLPRSGGGRRGRHGTSSNSALAIRSQRASRRHGRWRPVRSAGRCLDRRHGHGAGPLPTAWRNPRRSTAGT